MLMMMGTSDCPAQAMQKHRQARLVQGPPPATPTRLHQRQQQQQQQKRKGTTLTLSSWLRCLPRFRLKFWSSRGESAVCARGSASNKKLQLLQLLRYQALISCCMCTLCPAPAFCLMLLPWCAHASVAMVIVTLPSNLASYLYRCHTALSHIHQSVVQTKQSCCWTATVVTWARFCM